MNKINFLAEINDLKKVDNTNALVLASLIEILIDREVITRDEFNIKAKDGIFLL